MEMNECGAMTEGLVRFLEHLNKFKRPQAQTARKSWVKHLSVLIFFVKCGIPINLAIILFEATLFEAMICFQFAPWFCASFGYIQQLYKF